jgi:hypothetical protein
VPEKMGFSLTMCSTAASTSPSSFQPLVFRFPIHRDFEPFNNKSSTAHSSFQDYQVSSSGITDNSPYELMYFQPDPAFWPIF